MTHDLGEWEKRSDIKIRFCKKNHCQASVWIEKGKEVGSGTTHDCKKYFMGGGKGGTKTAHRIRNALGTLGRGWN